MADEFLRKEIVRLRDDVAEWREMRRTEVEQHHQELLDARKLPPMAQMTRLHKRYWLEPWMTTGTVTAGVLAFASFIVALFTPLHGPFGGLGALFVAITGGCLLTKLLLMNWNSKTEGQIRSRQERGFY